jgi:hypothetical protein
VLCTEHGYPPAEELDDDSEQLSESRLPEYAVLARRRWIVRFDTELEFYIDTYTEVVEEVLTRANVSSIKVEAVGEHFVIDTDSIQIVFPVENITHEENWIDIEFLAHVCARALAQHGHTLLVTMDTQLAVFAVVPTSLWLAIEELDLLEEFESVDVLDD